MDSARRSWQKPRFLPAAYEVMSAEIVSTISAHGSGAIAQLGERRVCNAKVVGSIPTGSTNQLPVHRHSFVDQAQRVMSHAGICLCMTHDMRAALVYGDGSCVLFKNSAICFDAHK
jgi:hypothetical protein